MATNERGSSREGLMDLFLLLLVGTALLGALAFPKKEKQLELPPADAAPANGGDTGRISATA